MSETTTFKLPRELGEVVREEARKRRLPVGRFHEDIVRAGLRVKRIEFEDAVGSEEGAR